MVNEMATDFARVVDLYQRTAEDEEGQHGNDDSDTEEEDEDEDEDEDEVIGRRGPPFNNF